MQRPEPHNERGQAPASGGEDTTSRLREKAEADRGTANRERVEQKIEQNNEERETIMAKDPSCGMDVNEARPGGKSDYQGTTYYFCSAGCKKTFDGDPAKYAVKRA